MHLFAAAWSLDRYIVDVWTVKFDIIRAVVRHFFQLFDASDRMLVSALTFPDIQWSSPVTVTADTPLIYYARESWFIKMTEVKDDLIANNNTINWIPESIACNEECFLVLLRSAVISTLV